MIISLIAAMDQKRGIGWRGGLPWRLSSDMKRFRSLTMGHHIVMGRKTYQSIGRPLPGRQTIIVTRNSEFAPEGSFIVHSLEEAIEFAKSRGEDELFVCGGADVYAQMLNTADRFYLTLVHADVGADTLFPEWKESDWIVEQSTHHDADENDRYPSTFKVLYRARAASGGDDGPYSPA